MGGECMLHHLVASGIICLCKSGVLCVAQIRHKEQGKAHHVAKNTTPGASHSQSSSELVEFRLIHFVKFKKEGIVVDKVVHGGSQHFEIQCSRWLK